MKFTKYQKDNLDSLIIYLDDCIKWSTSRTETEHNNLFDTLRQLKLLRSDID